MKRLSVRGIIITDKGLSVIFRRKIKDNEVKEYYALSGGGVDEGEDLQEALRRELREELNIEVEIEEFAFKTETEDRIEYFYKCKYLSGTFELNGEELERNSNENYYEPTFININKIEEYDIQEDVKYYLEMNQ